MNSKKKARKQTAVMLNDEERGMIRELAKAWGCSVGAAVRRLIREALANQR